MRRVEGDRSSSAGKNTKRWGYRERGGRFCGGCFRRINHGGLQERKKGPIVKNRERNVTSLFHRSGRGRCLKAHAIRGVLPSEDVHPCRGVQLKKREKQAAGGKEGIREKCTRREKKGGVGVP